MLIRSTVLIVALFALSFQSLSQEVEPKTINEAFDKIMKDHATWEIYKVVPVTKMKDFQNKLSDSVASKEQEVAGLQKNIETLGSEITVANDKIAELQKELGESQTKNDEITFLGMDFSKTLYQVIVWLIIGLLFILIILVYLMYVRSNSTSSQSKKEVDDLREELEKQRTQAHEKQVKLKRELQTAENLINEKGIRS